jgi:hypothetical protein
MFEWLKQRNDKKLHKQIHQIVVTEFEQELRESGVDMSFDNFRFVQNDLIDANHFYISRLCDTNLAAYYVFYGIKSAEYVLQELIAQIDEHSNYVAVEIGGCLFVTRKSMWKKMQNGYNLY